MLAARYEKADLSAIVNNNYSHLNYLQQAKFLLLLKKNEELSDGTLGDFQTDPVRFDLQLGVKQYNGRPFRVPHSWLAVFKKKVERQVDIGVQKRQPSSEWGSQAFIIPKLNQTESC